MFSAVWVIVQVKEDVLREERQPLLDLDDVEQLESELAACFDAPPPPPLNTRVRNFHRQHGIHTAYCLPCTGEVFMETPKEADLCRNPHDLHRPMWFVKADPPSCVSEC